MTQGIGNYNQDFTDFVNFASPQVQAGHSKKIARLTPATNDAPRSIGASRSGGVGGLSALFRWKSTKTANDVTRDLFKSSVANMFGGEAKIPESVKTAMKLEDFGKGKPLTARRIMAVKEAIDQYHTAFSTALAAAQANAPDAYRKAGPQGKAQLDALIAGIVERYMDEPDMIAVIIKNMDHILVGGDSRLRSADSVQQRMDNLRANYRELKEVAKNNPAALKAGLDFLDGLNGKSLPQGVIGKLIQASAKVPIKNFASLSASSSAMEIHKGVKQFMEDVNSVIESTGTAKVLGGGDEMIPPRELVESLLIARLSKGELKSVQAMFTSPAAAKTLRLYEDVMVGKKTAKGASHALELGILAQGNSYMAYVNRLKQVVDMAMGIPRRQFIPMESFGGQFNSAEIKGNAIFNDLVKTAKDYLAKERATYLNTTVKGTSAASTHIRQLIEQIIGAEVYEPDNVLQNIAAPCAQRLFNKAVAADSERIEKTGVASTVFAKDLTRGFVFKVGDTTLSTDLNTACNQIAQFVTRNPNATYDTLQPQDKKMANYIMAMFSQDTTKAASDGNGVALDPNLRESKLTFFFGQQNDTHVLSVNISADQRLIFEYEGRHEVKGLVHSDGSMDPVAAGSTMQYNLRVEFEMEEFTRLAGADYSQYDRDVVDTAQQRAQGPDSIKQMAQAIPPAYKFNDAKVKCYTEFKANFN